MTVERDKRAELLRIAEREMASLPTRIGRYRIRGELGRGGMGVVYDAIDERLGRPVALKVLHAREAAGVARSAEAASRFEREMRATAGIFHAHLVAILDAGIDRSSDPPAAYYVMERVEGISLEHRLQDEGTLPLVEGLHLASGIARGLAVIHRHGLVHRDLKPSNVLLTRQGLPKLSDFGLCRVLGESDGRSAEGRIVGSAHYLAPEQVQSRGVDAKADLFALGVLLIRIFTGSEPFDAPDLEAHFARILRDEPEGLERLDPGLRPLVARMVAKDPDARPRADEVAARLAGLAEDHERIAPPRARHRAQAVRRGLVWLAGPIALATALLVGLPRSEPANHPARLHDRADFLSESSERTLAARLAQLRAATGVDVHLLFAQLPTGESLEGFAESAFRDLDVGVGARDGALLAYDVRARRLRIEVGYGLESMLPDDFLGYLIHDHIRYLFESADRGETLRLAVRMVEHAVRTAQLRDGARLAAGTEAGVAGHRSGGGGASEIRSLAATHAAFRAEPDPPAHARFAPGSTPSATYARYLEWLEAGAFHGDLPMFTSESRAFLASWPMSPAYFDYVRTREHDQPHAVIEIGDRAVLHFTADPYLAPHFFRAGDGGWQMDLVAETRTVVNYSGGRYSWGLRSLDHPWVAALASHVVDVDGYLRLRDGDNRPNPACLDGC